MSLYSCHLFPRLCHLSLATPAIDRLRRKTLARASGEVLEIGFGTGLNVPQYPAAVRALTAVEPNPGMRERWESWAECEEPARFPVTVLDGRAETLPFPDASFDTAVSTFTLCSLPAPEALAEIHRVLRPGGRFLFLEHGASPDPGVRRLQKILTPIQKRVADGCRLDLEIARLVADSGLTVEQCRNRYLSRWLKFGTYLYRGWGRKV